MEPSIELLNSLPPEWMLMETKCLNHARILVGHVDKAFAILLWTHDILRMGWNVMIWQSVLGDGIDGNPCGLEKSN